MYYIIQENMFKEEGFDNLIRILDRVGLEYEVIKFIPFLHDIEFTTQRKDVWVWGSVNMAKVAYKYGWTPGSMYNENHDLEIYGPQFGLENMLNGDGIIIEFGDPLPESLPFAFFARPTKDTKAFSGQCFTHDSWNEYVKECIANDTKGILKAETRVLVAPLKDTKQEIRCWVVDGRVITASRYKLGSRVIYENSDDDIAVTIAQQFVNRYQPAKAFVIDVCLHEDQYKIVEINCINCSGFYAGNMNKMIEALENTFT